jgi:asparagine synthase (glutamine-hydrolysing)
MCGIAGIVGAGADASRDAVLAMNASMASRGPDDMGLWQEGEISLGHRRLAIIDCSAAGHQPMLREGKLGTHAVTFNGEIYNFLDLRRELAEEGCALTSRSDTEVLLQLLMRDADSALQKLVGMFAFGYWNPDRRTFLIARDRLGIKPVYYHISSEGVLTFASALSALLENRTIERRLNAEALEEFLATGCAIAPNTLYQGIQELPAGHLLEWTAGTIHVRRYWDVEWASRWSASEQEAVEELARILDRSLREHLISDVPVGAFLSGGLDSSSVVARAARFSDSSFQAFTVKFQEAKYDESHVASDVARHVGVKHSIIEMAQMPVDIDFCRKALKHVGQPFADSSCLPTYLVSSAASQHVKVVLSGDGGDELFAGYETFGWAERIQRARAIPAPLRRMALMGLGAFGNSERARQLRKGLQYSLASREEAFLRLKCIFSPEEIATFARPFRGQQPRLRRLRDFLARGAHLDPVAALSRWHSVFLVADMLRKVDCMSMAASIEVRVPLLDHRLVEFAHSLPPECKMRNGVRKFLLRQLVRSDLPASVFTHPKQGFSVPLHRGMTDQFISDSSALLLRRGSFADHLIESSTLQGLTQAVRKRERLNAWSLYTTTHLFWMLSQLELWMSDQRVAA